MKFKLGVLLPAVCIIITGCAKTDKVGSREPIHNYCGNAEPQAASAQTFPVFYTDIEKVADLIMACQIERGGICRTLEQRRGRDSAFMTSYSFGALGLIHAFQITGQRRYMDGAKKFVDFWMAHQNETADRFGVPGTFYDQVEKADGDVEPFIYKSGPNVGGPGYDASDADGLFVAITAYRYYLVTGDKGLLERYTKQFKLIGDSIFATMDRSDNATWCHPNYKTKYLMDICEVYAGLKALSEIFIALGKEDIAGSYATQAQLTGKTIETWWSEKDGWYHWFKKDGETNQALNWSVWYPDAAEQIWPLLWDVTRCEQEQSVTMWRNFNMHIPDWPARDVDWPSASNVAVKMGSLSKAVVHTSNILSKRLNDPGWHTNDCALTVFNCSIDFDLSGPVCVVEGSVIRKDGKFMVKLHSLANGPTSVRLRLPNRDWDIVRFNGKRTRCETIGAFEFLNYNSVQGQVNELEVVFKNPRKDWK